MTKLIKQPLAEEHLKFISQGFILKKSILERQQYYLYPFGLYISQRIPNAFTDQTRCWSIGDPLRQWLLDLNLPIENVLIDVGTTTERKWTISLPPAAATLYKLTWL